MFDSLIKLGKDVVDVVAAPVEIAIDSARIVTKPVADLANEAVDVVKEASEEITK